MFNANEGYSLSDFAAVAGNNGKDGFTNNGAWWIIILFLFIFMGNKGSLFGNDNGAAAQGSLTRSDLSQEMNFQGLNNTVNGIQQDLCNGFRGVNQNLNDIRFDNQKCCCETNRNIDAVRYDQERNTCNIINAIHEDGNATRALINANVVQDLRDKLANKDRDLITAEFAISQKEQNQYLVNQLSPKSVPAYITCSPYESAMLGWKYGCMN